MNQVKRGMDTATAGSRTAWLTRSVLLCLCLMGASLAAAQTGPCSNGGPLAFPGAEGFGRCAQGGRGGSVIDVINLNNSGAGSLRECAEVMSGPRTCRIMVAGTVSLGTYDIIIRNDNVTIDGSIFPMALKDGGITVRANHTVIRHLRVRPGPASLVQRGVSANGISYLSREDGSGTHDHICDHCSVSWGTDDLVGVFFGTDNVTIQDSIIAEALHGCAGCGSRGLLIGLNAKKVSILRTLSAHNFIRFPEATNGEIDFVNNVHYNGNGVSMQINPVYQPVKINVVGTYWKDGPSAVPANLGYRVLRTIGDRTYSASSGIFVQDNIGRFCNPNDQPTCIIWGDNGGIAVRSQRYDYPLMATVSAAQAYDIVLNNSGAQPRDAADARVVSDVRNGTGALIASPAQVGGWPTLTGGSSPPPPPPAPPAAYAVSVSPASIAPGGALSLTWSAPDSHSSTDWIAIYLVKMTDTGNGIISQKYVPAGSNGTLNFMAPTTPNNYEFRYYLNNGYTRAATSQPFTVTNAPAPPPTSSTDINADGTTNAADVQLGINQALGIFLCGSGDVDKNAACNVIDVQLIVNAALGLTGP